MYGFRFDRLLAEHFVVDEPLRVSALNKTRFYHNRPFPILCGSYPNNSVC